jgi:hypothetical protein
LRGESTPSKKLFLASTTVLFVLVSLLFIGSVEASSEIWSQTYGGTSSDEAEAMVQTSDGGYALAGDTSSFGAGGYDAWLVKTDEYGIPEFPSWIILPLLLITTLAAIIGKQRLLRKSVNT